ncbi:MAG: transaldolase [Anaerolineaceae bacterium]|nr:transaldolase [Anaerolineaceae bacterium]
MSSKNHVEQTADLGQSIWLDYLDREFIASGELKTMIDAGIRGITSNPSIFQEAIAEGGDYDDDIAELVAEGKDDKEIYEAMAVADIQHAADLLAPVYIESKKLDGYISLEANPDLAYDTEATIEEVRRLHKAVNRPNLMIKVPATSAGIPAIATLISEGININITLMFSLTHYDRVADAYLRGLEERLADGFDIDHVASVASFFVSRVDTAVDEQLDELNNDAAAALKGKIGIANAKMAYTRYLNVFSSKRWQNLAAHGARPQRVLYGSTSVKNPNYPDTMYADHLIGANTVNTLPLETIKKFNDHGTVAPALTTQLEKARSQLVQLGNLGIDLERITQQLQDDGVTKFADAFSDLMAAIRRARTEEQQKQETLQPEPVLED